MNEKEIRKKELSYFMYIYHQTIFSRLVYRTGVNNSLVFVYSAVRSSDNRLYSIERILYQGSRYSMNTYLWNNKAIKIEERKTHLSSY
jgi:hypothetical protein